MFLQVLVSPIYQPLLFGKKIDMPVFLITSCDAEIISSMKEIEASARAAEKFGYYFIVCHLWEIILLKKFQNISSGPKLFQLYVHKDQINF